MRFGGHEKFAVREGWLHKGLRLLKERPEKFIDPHACDYLGVGLNMARSIRYWLLGTGLIENKGKSKKQPKFLATELGELIYKHDPYFNLPGTWWALHVNLINNKDRTTTWYWFFNFFYSHRFDRPLCLENLKRYIKMQGIKRKPSPTTLENDLVCLLHSYSRVIPSPETNPEEALDCPFSELNLLTHYKTSGFYRFNDNQKTVPFQLLGYSLACAYGWEKSKGTTSRTDLRIREVMGKEGGPAKAFLLSAEGLYELALRAAREDEHAHIQVVGLAGERALQIAQYPALSWLASYYSDKT